MERGSELTSPEYWDSVWLDEALPALVDLSNPALRTCVPKSFDRLIGDTVSGLDGARVLEIGCARSVWLPHIASRYGAHVTGLDRSPTGCARARALLGKAGVGGEIVCADLFDPPAGMLGKFDVVFSIGVVEHFPDTAGIIATCARFLQRGGRMLTIIPNMNGLVGALQRLLDPPIYRLHVPLAPDALARAHRAAGLDVVHQAYILSANWNVVIVGGLRRFGLERTAIRGLSALSKAFWQLDRAGIGVPPNRLTSPYIACRAVKPLI
jgi:2-polyprenyl-3-methyl-5-hydroxy-6-metoxy-1,4-benzoquinol methylase